MRLVHGEGDGLSGLVVDLYDNVIAIEWFSAGMFRQREVIRQTLADLFPGAQFYWFAEKRIQKQESFDCWDMPVPTPVIVQENGLKFRVDIGSMHKTGYFADQRDNRLLLTTHTRGKSVLDLCCHSGGFSVYAKALGHAQKVLGVDLDPLALDVARANAELNHAEVEFEQADVYEWLKSANARGQRYDVVILDPAKQTRSQEGVDGAIAQYVAMNRLAMEVVSEGGILLTCSCSGLVTEDQFLDAIRRAAAHAGKNAQVFRLSGAAADHPWLAEVPESRYLKAVWVRITAKNS
jgi:23S rRNA (cytosine1962-C5)-methyltransferase